MIERKHKDKIEVEGIVSSVRNKFIFLNTRLILPRKCIRDKQEIDTIVSALQKQNFIVLFGECVKDDFVLVIENSDSLMNISINSDFKSAYDKISEFLLECMDKIISYPYKLILEVY